VSAQPVEEGRAALRAGDAAAARRIFESALGDVESGEVWEGLAEALYLERKYSAAATHDERAYSAYRREGRHMAAGRAARTISWVTGYVFGDWAVRSGWLGRSRTILSEAGEDRAVPRGDQHLEIVAHRRSSPTSTSSSTATTSTCSSTSGRLRSATGRSAATTSTRRRGMAKELEALGARRIDVGQLENASFIPMADPEGNEFCVCPGAPLAE
jgi:hypothetical protein